MLGKLRAYKPQPSVASKRPSMWYNSVQQTTYTCHSTYACHVHAVIRRCPAQCAHCSHHPAAHCSVTAGDARLARRCSVRSDGPCGACHAALHCVGQRCTAACTAPHSTAPHSTALHRTAQHRDCCRGVASSNVLTESGGMRDMSDGMRAPEVCMPCRSVGIDRTSTALSAGTRFSGILLLDMRHAPHPPHDAQCVHSPA